MAHAVNFAHNADLRQRLIKASGHENVKPDDIKTETFFETEL